MVTVQSQTLNQRGDVVQSLKAKLVVFRKKGTGYPVPAASE
jgi:hypothetical protein